MAAGENSQIEGCLEIGKFPMPTIFSSEKRQESGFNRFPVLLQIDAGHANAAAFDGEALGLFREVLEKRDRVWFTSEGVGNPPRLLVVRYRNFNEVFGNFSLKIPPLLEELPQGLTILNGHRTIEGGEKGEGVDFREGDDISLRILVIDGSDLEPGIPHFDEQGDQFILTIAIGQ